MNYFEFYGGDYARDTGDLTLMQHGAYILLLSHYYSTEKALPAEPALLYRIARAMTSAEQQAVREIADKFFPVAEDSLRHNARADDGIDKALKRINAAKANGSMGGRPKNPVGNPAGNPLGNPVGYPAKTQSGEASPDPIHQENKSTSRTSSGTDAGASLAAITLAAMRAYNAALAKPVGRLSKVREVGIESRAKAVSRGLKVAAEICREEYGNPEVTPKFWADYFAAVAAHEFYSGRSGGGKGHDNWEPTFDVLVRPDTMLKVYDKTAGASA